MVTIRSVNKALKARGYPDELVKGEGYFYFWGDDASLWYTSTVSVYAINHIPTVEGWIERYESLRKQYHEVD